MLTLFLFLIASCAVERSSPVAKAIRIGMICGLSGPTAAWGIPAQRGAQLAVEDANRRGGVLGAKLELRVEDDQGKPEDAAAAAAKLITRDGVVAIVGADSSSRTLAAAPICQAHRRPLVSPTASLPAVTEKGNFIFRVCATDADEASALARFARERLKASRVAILKDVKNDYSVGAAKIFSEEFVRAGGAIIAEQSYSEGDADFRSQLATIRGARPDVLVVPGYYGEVAQIAMQARELGMTIPLIGGSGWNSRALIEIGGKALDGCYYMGPMNSTNAEFIGRFEKRFGVRPDAATALAYDAAALVIDAIGRAGSSDGEKIRQALAATTNFSGVSGNFSMTSARNPRKAIGVYAIRRAEVIEIDQVEPK